MVHSLSGSNVLQVDCFKTAVASGVCLLLLSILMSADKPHASIQLQTGIKSKCMFGSDWMAHELMIVNTIMYDYCLL